LPALPRYFTLPENNDAKEALLSDTALEKTFAHFRRGIIGIDQTFPSPYGEQKLLYRRLDGEWPSLCTYRSALSRANRSFCR
jgi:hypothetical protein